MTKLIIVGGFLGAGKTTLLMESAKILASKGYKVGLITNDQAAGLVDSVYLQNSGSTVLEVSGSCFCCNFNGFIEAIRAAITEGECEIILAEPVGSCADLAATIIRPLLAYHTNLVDLAPMTVLADPNRLSHSLDGNYEGLHESAGYIYRKQLEDAGIILIGKSDLLDEESRWLLREKTQATYKNADVGLISSKNISGVEDWLNEMVKGKYVDHHAIDMDYDTYAEGEAVLGWLNTEIELSSKEDVDWGKWFRQMMSNLAKAIDRQQLIVGHVKAIIRSEQDFLIANITGNKDTLQTRGHISPGVKASLTINARIQTTPNDLEDLIFRVFDKSLDWQGEHTIISLNTLSPGRPNPTFRM